MKLLLVLVVTGFLVILLVGLMFKIFFDSNAHKLVEKNVFNYVDYIIQDIGAPPDTVRAKQISD